MTVPEQPPTGTGPLGRDPLSTAPSTAPSAAPSTAASGTAPVSTGSPGAGAAPATGQRHRARTAGRGLALALLIFVTVVLVLFVVFNTHTVRVSLVFGDVQLALIVALLLAAVLGGLLVMLATFVVRARSNPRD